MPRHIENPVSHAQWAKLTKADPAKCNKTPLGQYRCDACGWRRCVESHTPHLGWAVVQDHFDRIEGPVITYKPKPGHEAEAAGLWWRHGICLKCGHRSITGGRCINCGEDYNEVIPEKIILVRQDGEHWYADIRGEPRHNRDSAYRASLTAFDAGAGVVYVPAYDDIQQRLGVIAEQELRRQADVALIAKNNSLENFTLWAAHIVMDAIVGGVNVDDRREGDWFNVICAHKSMRSDKYRPNGHPLVKVICDRVYRSIRADQK